MFVKLCNYVCIHSSLSKKRDFLFLDNNLF